MYALIIDEKITVFYYSEDEALWNANLLEAQGHKVNLVNPLEAKRVRDYTTPI